MANPSDIRIIKIIDADIQASHKGGSLLEIPFQLSIQPDALWEDFFIQNWNRPLSFTSMHRPGIARIEGDRVILDGTTVDEVGRVHQGTLKQVVEETNRQYASEMQKQKERAAREDTQRRADKASLDEERAKARDISFD